jgi:lysophospholipase L1-like esterase
MDYPDAGLCKLGVLAFGDSITNGGGELQWGVALQSWALWVARGLGLPFTSYAVDGATVSDVVRAQIPGFRSLNVDPDGLYDLGCLYIGVNDVRLPSWDAAAYERDLRSAHAFLAERCDRLIAATAPLDLGRPRAGDKVHEMNRIVERVAVQSGALLLDLRRFGGRELVMADHVHPTAFGQVEIAERALTLLAADGMEVKIRPRQMLRYETTWYGRVRRQLTYGYRHMKVSARDLWLRSRVRGLG